MYYWEVQEILENSERALSASEIYLRFVEKCGHCNKTTLIRTLTKLKRVNIIDAELRNIEHQRGRYTYYTLSTQKINNIIKTDIED